MLPFRRTNAAFRREAQPRERHRNPSGGKSDSATLARHSTRLTLVVCWPWMRRGAFLWMLLSCQYDW